MQAEIITIGTELLLGQIVDTNAADLAQQLAAAGLNLYRMTTVGDNEDRVAAAVREALARADVVITSGGLGPTVDDVTRQAIARATGRELVLDKALLAQVEAFFARRGLTMSDNNRRQACLPQGSIPIENPVGTAPGFVVEQGGKLVIALPGVPRELKFLMREHVIPFLRERLTLRGVIKSKTLRTVGITESRVDRLIGDLEESENPTVGLAAHPGQIDVRLTARADDEAQAEALIQAMEKQVRKRLGDVVYGVGAQTLEERVTGMLRERGLTLAVVETNTGGLICQRLTRTPHGRFALSQGIMAPTEAALAAGLGVPLFQWETVGPQTAVEAATNLQETSGADLALAVVGDPDPEIQPYSGPSGVTRIALVTPRETRQRELRLAGVSDLARTWLANAALDLVRRSLLS
jgi:nicotinamide-nucleotide amidase